MEITNEAEEGFLFWKNLILTAAFFLLTPITLATSLFSLISLRHSDAVNTEVTTNYPNYLSSTGAQIYAPHTVNESSVSQAIEAVDAREEIVRQYLLKYNSPLTEHAADILAAADKYELDFRLITAIAQQESNLCKIIPEGTYNCWGWGIHSQGTLGFTSFAEGIEAVSKGLRNEYINKGYLTIEQIMSKYTPMSDGTWARGVNQFMTEME